jgi:membrane protein implicated in regulation of membrane protease activity
MSTEPDHDIARKSRHVALVIAGAMVAWFGANILGGAMEWPGRYALLFDFAALAALIYAMVNIYQIWRLRQGNNQNGQG